MTHKQEALRMSHIVTTAGGYESDDAVAPIEYKTWLKSFQDTAYLSQLKWNESMYNATKLKPEPKPEPEPESDKKSDTKNVKGNRQIVRGTYSAHKYFKIPDGLDLEDKTKVAKWGLEPGNLYIVLVDGTTINTVAEPIDSGGKYEIDMSGGEPDETLIMDADEFAIVYSEDEEDEPDKNESDKKPESDKHA